MHPDSPTYFQLRNAGLQYAILFSVVYPLAFAGEGLHRLWAHWAPELASERDGPPSLFAATYANAQIAVSYAIWARELLKHSGRADRARRLS
jgi:hypothetical protein